MEEEATLVSLVGDVPQDWRMCDSPYVKSPVASLCLACSSVRNRVRVTISVLTCSVEEG